MPNIMSEALLNLRRELTHMQQDLDQITELIEPEPDLGLDPDTVASPEFTTP